MLLIVGGSIAVGILTFLISSLLIDAKPEWGQPPEERFGTNEYEFAQKRLFKDLFTKARLDLENETRLDKLPTTSSAADVAAVKRYIASDSSAAHVGDLPQDVEGDPVFPGATVVPHRLPGAGFGDRFVVFAGKKEDILVSKTSLAGERVPQIFRISRGADVRDRHIVLGRKIARMHAIFRDGTAAQKLAYLRRHSFTEGNIARLKDVIREPGRINDPQHDVTFTRVLRFMRGYRGEIDPRPRVRSLRAMKSRMGIIRRGMLRTARNADEVGSKGTRTFWFNPGVAAVTTLLTSIIALLWIQHSQANQQRQQRLQAQQQQQQLVNAF